MIWRIVAANLALIVACTTADAELSWDATARTVVAAPGATQGRATFVFRNTGKEPVAIKLVKSSCDCAVARVSRDVLAPGATSELHVTLNPPAGATAAETLVTVSADDGSSTVLKVGMRAANRLKVTPAFVWWPSGAEPIEQEFLIEPADGSQDIAALRARTSDAGFTLHATHIDGTRRWCVRIKPASTHAPRLTTLTFEASVSGSSSNAAIIHAYAKVVQPRQR